jgi:predicted glycosyltransferase
MPREPARGSAVAIAAWPSVRVLLVSHDGFGLGHTRRNSRIAGALRAAGTDVEVTVLTGVASRHTWLGADGVRVVRMPPLTKDAAGVYTGHGRSLAKTLTRRARIARETVELTRPDLVLVDRHPFGVDGELRGALAMARRQGAVVLLGLRDVLDSPAAVRAELAGPEWVGASRVVDEVLVYGDPRICDHVREYGLGAAPRYVGVVTAAPPTVARSAADDGCVVVAAGGGGDGRAVLELAASLVGLPRYRSVVAVTGPAGEMRSGLPGGVHVVSSREDCAALFATATATVQMGGYNSTYEAVVSGLRPVLVPRRAPRREQAIRATRLTCLGLADVLDPGADADELRWLLDRDRTTPAERLAASGLALDGADTVARHILDLVGHRSSGAPAVRATAVQVLDDRVELSA